MSGEQLDSLVRAVAKAIWASPGPWLMPTSRSTRMRSSTALRAGRRQCRVWRQPLGLRPEVGRRRFGSDFGIGPRGSVSEADDTRAAITGGAHVDALAIRDSATILTAERDANGSRLTRSARASW